MQPGDEATIGAFLAPRADAAMFLLSNLRAAGLVDTGAPYQGGYAGAFRDGDMVGIAAHYWNGMIVLQAPQGIAALMEVLRQGSTRRVAGIIGPHSQAVAARAALGLAQRLAIPRLHLMTLPLAALRMPAALADGRVACRRSGPGDLDLAVAWQAAARRNALGSRMAPELLDEVRAEVAGYQRQGGHWMAFAEGRPVAACAVNAALSDRAQIGAVWTPPDLRGRGYARAVVAGALCDLQRAGIARAVLFVDVRNAPAAAVYRALGFTVAEDFAAALMPADAASGNADL